MMGCDLWTHWWSSAQDGLLIHCKLVHYIHVKCDQTNQNDDTSWIRCNGHCTRRWTAAAAQRHALTPEMMAANRPKVEIRVQQTLSWSSRHTSKHVGQRIIYCDCDRRDRCWWHSRTNHMSLTVTSHARRLDDYQKDSETSSGRRTCEKVQDENVIKIRIKAKTHFPQKLRNW